jgi:hypothetical protein
MNISESPTSASFSSIQLLSSLSFWYPLYSSSVSQIFFDHLPFLEIFRTLKKDMILSNKLLYIIDFEALAQTERDNITKFLSKY